MSLSFVCSVNHQFEYTPHLLNESSTTLKKNYRMLLFSCYIYSFPIVKFFSLRKENGSKRKNVNLTVERSILLCHSTSFRSDLPDFTISIQLFKMKNELLMIVGWGVIKICRNAKELSNRGKTEGILSKDIFQRAFVFIVQGSLPLILLYVFYLIVRFGFLK